MSAAAHASIATDLEKAIPPARRTVVRLPWPATIAMRWRE